LESFIIFNIETALKRSVPAEEQMIIVFDLSNFGMSCMDYEVQPAAIQKRTFTSHLYGMTLRGKI
jgi:hypothetical protein